jgi:hypothetical protein
MRTLLQVFVVACCLMPVASAQNVATTLYEFGRLTTFRCDFPQSEGRLTSSRGVITSAKRETFADLVVEAVDYRHNTARFVLNAGSTDLALIDGRLTVSFVETTGIGNVNVLSVFKQTGSVSTYRAAYSRHSAFTTGGLAISQSYGTCRGFV